MEEKQVLVKIEDLCKYFRLSSKEELKADLDGATYTPIPDDMMPYYD